MRQQKSYKSPILNWHFIVFGIIPLFFGNFMIMRELGDGEFLSTVELIHEVQCFSWSSSDFIEVIIGLFTVGLCINFVISLIRFKGYRLVALGKQILFLAVEFAILVVFDLIMKSLITVVVVIIIIVGVLSVMIKKRNRNDAFWDLYSEVIEYEDKLTSDQKRAIASQLTDAMLDKSKSETDTDDIDAIRVRNRPHT